jgi:hypothetical protein
MPTGLCKTSFQSRLQATSADQESSVLTLDKEHIIRENVYNTVLDTITAS